MSRCVRIGLLITGCLLIAFAVLAQEEIPPGLVREDLQLISQESLEHWTPMWTGPIQAATILAWLADHGYSALLSDLNGDGVVDELDTIALADEFGTGIMEADAPRGTTDVQLVIGLANYVAQKYPDQFVLKIYDPSFTHEYTTQGFGAFEETAVQGIRLQLADEPSIRGYIYEMGTDEGVIVGLEEGFQRNRYFSGRSYLDEETDAGHTPLDFAWAKENLWLTGHQGQILQTVGKMEDRFYLDFLNEWIPVEFMLALSPVSEDEPDNGEPSGDCPDLTVRILDESCVYDPRQQAYLVTVWAEILNVGTVPVTSSFMAALTSTTHPGGVAQLITIPPILPPGDTIPLVLTFMTLPEPSGAAPCPLTYRVGVDLDNDIVECDERNNEAYGDVCCDTSARGACCLPDGSCTEMSESDCDAEGGTQFHPGVDCSVVQCPPVEEGCPDLVMEVIDFDCVTDNQRQFDVTLVVEVTNVGTAPVTSSFQVQAETDCGSDFETIFPPLNPSDSTTVTFEFTCSPNQGCAPNLVLTLDPFNSVQECEELL